MSSHSCIAAFCFLLVASSWEPAAATAAAGSRRLQQIIVPRVVGGETAAKDRFPYMCRLTDQNHKHVCGGVLIAPKAVLTAAHCVDPSVDGAANQNLLVSVGAHDISQASLGASDALVTKVVDIKIHPEFEIDELRKGNDIAILILRDASLAQSVPLPLKGFSPNQTLLTLGWGQGSPVLQQLKLEPMTNAACADYYPGIGDNIQCARSLTGDACKGDSGGPLLIADSPDWRISKGDPRFDTLIALTSFGVEPCSDDGYPGAYTLVGPFRDWIDTELQSVKKSDQQVTTSITNGDTEDDEQGRSPLWIASTGGLVDRAKILIKNGAHLDEAEKDGSTPLTQASAYQHLEIVKLLIAAGADVNITTAMGRTPMIIAATTGNAAIIQELLNADADPDHLSNDGFFALLNAANKGFIDVVELLLSSGADVSNTRNDGLTALIGACLEGHTVVMRALLEAGANVDAAWKDGLTPLIHVSAANNSEAVKLLIDAGADVNLDSAEGRTPVMNAAFNGNAGMLQDLLNADADPNHISNDGYFALYNAAEQGYLDIVELLISRGADVNNVDSEGWTALIGAANGEHPEAVKLLLAAGADPDPLTVYGLSPIFIASAQNRLDIMELLISAGACLDPETDKKLSPLQIASFFGRNPIVKALLDAGARINAAPVFGSMIIDSKTYPEGTTSLHFAVIRQHISTVKILLKYGADKSIEDLKGNTPRDVVPFGVRKLAKLLERD